MPQGKSKKKIKRFGLARNCLPKNCRWQNDIDYIHKLSEEEKDWLNKFLLEYYFGSVKKDDKNALHAKSELRKDCYNRKNRQNRDAFSIFFLKGVMNNFPDNYDEENE